MLLFVIAALVAGGAAVLIAARRDLGASLSPRHVAPRSRDRLLGSTSRLAVRTELPTLVVWIVAAGTFAAILGAFSKTIAEQARKVDLHAFTQVDHGEGYLALSFVCSPWPCRLFATSHISAIRDDESSGRLETLFALPIARRSWLVGRLAVATGSSIALALMVGVLAWAGAASQSPGVSLGSLVEAGANCIPAALCFLGLGALLFATFPRLSGGARARAGGHRVPLGAAGRAGQRAPVAAGAFAVSSRCRSAAVCIQSAGRAGHDRGRAGRAVAAVEVFIRRDLQSG